jgi:glycosyl transferase family 87
VTRKRIRAYATLIALSLWTIWAVDVSVPGAVDRLGKVKGTDFLQFYAAGSFVRDGQPARLYDGAALNARTQSVAPQSRETVFVPIQSPQMALAFAPLSALSYPAAVSIWIALIAVLYAGACAIVWRVCTPLHQYRYEAIACCAASPALYSTVLHGQTSVLALVALALALSALRRGAPTSAGLALGLLAFKPHWVAAAGAVFAVAMEWRVVAGLIASAAAQIGLTAALVGARVMAAYWHMLRSVQQLGDLLEPHPGDSLRSFFRVFLPWPTAAFVAYAAGAALALLAAASLWRRQAVPFEIRASAVVLAMVLVSPHAFSYDLILLVPVFFLLGSWTVTAVDRGRAMRVEWALCALYIAPILSALPAPLRLQFSVTAMAALLYSLGRSVQRQSTPNAQKQHLPSAGSASSAFDVTVQAEIGHATARPAEASVAAR